MVGRIPPPERSTHFPAQLTSVSRFRVPRAVHLRYPSIVTSKWHLRNFVPGGSSRMYSTWRMLTAIFFNLDKQTSLRYAISARSLLFHYDGFLVHLEPLRVMTIPVCLSATQKVNEYTRILYWASCAPIERSPILWKGRDILHLYVWSIFPKKWANQLAIRNVISLNQSDFQFVIASFIIYSLIWVILETLSKSAYRMIILG